MRWTRELRPTSVTRAGGESVWSWRPDAGAKLCGDDLRSDGDKKARSPGRARRKPLKPLRREGRVFRWTCGDYTRVLPTHCTRGCGCSGHPAFPAPSDSFEGTTFPAKLARMRGEIAKLCL